MSENEQSKCLSNVLAAFGCLAAIVFFTANGLQAADPPQKTGAGPELRSELLNNGPIPCIGTFGSPDAARTNLLSIRNLVNAGAKAKARAMIIMAKGEPGFCVWDSKNYDYSIRGVSTRDFLGEFVTACKAQGITPGVFYDITDVRYEGIVRYGGPIGAPYFTLIKQQVAELFTRYPGFRFLVLKGAARLSKSQWSDLREVISSVSSNCCILCHPWALMAKEPMGLAFNWTKGTTGSHWEGTTGIPWKAGTTAQSVYQGCVADNAAGQASVMLIWPDKETGSMSGENADVLRQVREMLERNPPATLLPINADKQTPAERIKQLKELLDGGIITREEFDKKKKEIVDSL